MVTWSRGLQHWHTSPQPLFEGGVVLFGFFPFTWSASPVQAVDCDAALKQVLDRASGLGYDHVCVQLLQHRLPHPRLLYEQPFLFHIPIMATPLNWQRVHEAGTLHTAAWLGLSSADLPKRAPSPPSRATGWEAWITWMPTHGRKPLPCYLRDCWAPCWAFVAQTTEPTRLLLNTTLTV